MKAESDLHSVVGRHCPEVPRRATSATAADSAYSIGAIYPTLPPGCSSPDVRGTTYELCGKNWYQPSYGANGVYYRAVPAP